MNFVKEINYFQKKENLDINTTKNKSNKKKSKQKNFNFQQAQNSYDTVKIFRQKNLQSNSKKDVIKRHLFKTKDKLNKNQFQQQILPYQIEVNIKFNNQTYSLKCLSNEKLIEIICTFLRFIRKDFTILKNKKISINNCKANLLYNLCKQDINRKIYIDIANTKQKIF